MYICRSCKPYHTCPFCPLCFLKCQPSFMLGFSALVSIPHPALIVSTAPEIWLHNSGDAGNGTLDCYYCLHGHMQPALSSTQSKLLLSHISTSCIMPALWPTSFSSLFCSYTGYFVCPLNAQALLSVFVHCAHQYLHLCQFHPSSSISPQTVIPKAVDSLKVLAELPIVVVLMYQVNPCRQSVTAHLRTYVCVWYQ